MVEMSCGNQSLAVGVSRYSSQRPRPHPLSQTKKDEGCPAGFKSESGSSRRNQCHHLPANKGSLAQRPKSCLLVRSQFSSASTQSAMKSLRVRHLEATDRCILHEALEHPQITVDGLRELEPQKYADNVMLRMDINFADDVHFQPVAGAIAEDKKAKSTRYWEAVRIELEVCIGLYQSECDDTDACSCEEFLLTPRLPRLFEELRDLLISLSRDEEFDVINSHLDVAFLVQQLEQGVLDVSPLASWIGDLIKRHCAPTRDCAVDKTIDKIIRGSSAECLCDLVAGLRELFEMLETMKMDVANHQISDFRETYVASTVQMLQTVFSESVQQRPASAQECKRWIGVAMFDATDATPTFTHAVRGVLSWLGTPLDARLPPSFDFDLDRLNRVKVYLHEMAYVDCCVEVYGIICQSLHPDRHLLPPAPTLRGLKGRFWSILSDMRATYSSESEIQSALELHILQEASYGTGSIQLENLERIHNALEQARKRPMNECPIYQVLQDRFCHNARLFISIHSSTISEEQRGWRKLHRLLVSRNAYPSIEEMARSIAHVTTLHWRVWADLVYLPD